MDKILAFIVIFLIIVISLSAVLVMGAVPRIFQTGEETENQTSIISQVNQSIAKLMYDEDIKDDRADQKRDLEIQLIRDLIKSEGINDKRMLTNQQNILRNINQTIEQNKEDIEMNLNISKEHKQVAKDHDIIQNNTNNTTNRIEQMLTEYRDHSVRQLQNILDVVNKTHAPTPQPNK